MICVLFFSTKLCFVFRPTRCEFYNHNIITSLFIIVRNCYGGRGVQLCNTSLNLIISLIFMDFKGKIFEFTNIKLKPLNLFSWNLASRYLLGCSTVQTFYFLKIPFSLIFLIFFTLSQLKSQEVYTMQPHKSPTTHLYTLKNFQAKFSWKNNFAYNINWD